MTNFDISRYDVERIMESNGLLSGEMARRTKDVVNPCNEIAFHSGEPVASKEINGDASDWTRMALYQQSSSSSSSHEKAGVGDFKFSNAGPGPGPIGIEVLNSEKMVSNASSLVTSLSSSREGSPDKNVVVPMQFGLPPPLGSRFFPGPTTTSNAAPWIPSTAQMRPQVPLFSAWTDAS